MRIPRETVRGRQYRVEIDPAGHVFVFGVRPHPALGRQVRDVTPRTFDALRRMEPQDVDAWARGVLSE